MRTNQADEVGGQFDRAFHRLDNYSATVRRQLDVLFRWLDDYSAGRTTLS